MGDIELKHSARGSSWQKKGAKYISRVKKNGKWVYEYAQYAKAAAGAAKHNVVTYANRAANKATGVNPNYASSKNGMPHDYKVAVHFPLDQEGKVVVDKKAANYNKALYRTTSSKNLALQKAARKRKLHAVGVNAQRKINKGKKKVAELLDRLQKKYESEKRRYEGKKAGRKSAKLSKERQKRHKQNNTIKLNNKQRVTFSEVKLGRRK